eukprot:TRINITY_DN2987_c0_g1_i1.p1 TRINITY_DN2987_c0_g1~~TRINITY_DN2987_c0_g1_i1.p1  ORF type:complete len:122 (+),score=32.53 TRINITY_DN2987_c0_g1_i1:99-464(+)
MLAFLSLASLLALSQAAILPAGVSAASCVNYPFCGPSPDDGAYLVPGGAAVLAAQKAVQHQHYIASIANPPIVPGLDAHNAALNAQLALMGIPAGQLAHQAALARVRQQQEEIIAIQNSLF